MAKKSYKRLPPPSSNLAPAPALTPAEIAAANAPVGPNTIPIIGSPSHVGQVPISQPGNTNAVWADPLVQGTQADGTTAATISPVLISGAGPDGNQHKLSTDPNGALNVKVQNDVNMRVSDSAGQPVFSTNEALNAWLSGSDIFNFDGSGNLQVTGTLAVTQPTGTNLHVVVDSTPTTAVTLPAGQAVELLDGAGTNKASISAAGAVKVDGSAVTQPVSAAALPLPSGAALEAGNLATLTVHQQFNDWQLINIEKQILQELKAMRLMWAATLGMHVEDDDIETTVQ